MAARPNVLVLVLDSVRAHNTSLHGYSHRTTPRLEGLAARTATDYRFAYAPSTTSISSHVSMFTGLHEDEHRVYGTDRTLVPGSTIWETLQGEYGYETGLFTVNPQFSKPVGLQRGFTRTVLEIPPEARLPFPEARNPAAIEVSEDGPVPAQLKRAALAMRSRTPVRSLANGLARLRDDGGHDSADMLDAFFDWQASRAGPWAAFVNLMDAHAPYRPATEYNLWADEDLLAVQEAIGGGHFVTSREVLADGSWWQPSALEHLYDGAIRQADALVGRVVDELRDRDAFDDTLLVVTADHGEGFGEPSRLHPGHHVFAHTAGVHEVQTHVPLLVSAPDGHGGATVDAPASLTALPTAIESAVTDGFEPGTFCPTGPVLVSRGAGNDDRLRIDDTFASDGRTTLPDRAYACYEETDTGVRKFVRSGGVSATISVHGPGVATVVGDDDGGRVAAAFPGPADAAVRRIETASLDDSARERLEQFGYLS